MPNNFDIDNPIPNPAYPAMSMIPINGNHSSPDYTKTKMWIKEGTGACPTGYQNPFEAGAMEVFGVQFGSWSAGNSMSVGPGQKYVRVWYLEPGSPTIQHECRPFSIVSLVLTPIPHGKPRKKKSSPKGKGIAPPKKKGKSVKRKKR